ncbi:MULTISPECIES: Pnap_2097 family protein [unclassified Rhizobium]|uniref:Pnap_2097 family protein n=1 Tax=unclassified Rhizobium TaxID=2613769 RepID=UPI001FD05386|nr:MULTISPECIES: Pnap_2097 family protein [unclassified Rhizobium]
MSLRPCPTQSQQDETESHVLGMAEMGYRGLSEQWLLRRAGDLHWRLIAKAMGQQEAQFKCAKGEPLYAAFCSTSLRLSNPDIPSLGGRLELSGELFRTSQQRLASRLRVRFEGDIIGELILASTFVGRSADGTNHTIVRRSPKVMAVPPDAPLSVQRSVDRGAAAARSILQKNRTGLDTFTEEKILPCPATDFNAAALLYFPSYSAIADRALFQAGERRPELLASRHVSYVGNVEPGEPILVTFKRFYRGYLINFLGARDRPLATMRIRLQPSRRQSNKAALRS